jgi:hypothetical protein
MERVINLLKGIDIIKLGIAIVMNITFIVIIWAIINKPIPEGNKDVVVFSLGLIEGVLLTIANYYWGSSRGSKEKTEQISKLMDKPEKPEVTIITPKKEDQPLQ